MNAVTMCTIFRIKILVWILVHSFKFMGLFCWNFGAWLLGLRPGPASTSHFTTLRQQNAFHNTTPNYARASHGKRRKRKRPLTRTARHMAMKRLCHWVLPCVVKNIQVCLRQMALITKKSTSLTTDLVFLACGSLKLVLVTAWQAQGGRRKHRRAVKRCFGLKPAVFEAIFDDCAWSSSSRSAFVNFLSLQVFAGVCEQPAGAVLYQLSSPYLNYVGSTKYELQRHRCQGSSPVNRAYQHLLEHVRPQPATGSSNVGRRKCRLFRNVRPSDHMFWVLEQGPEPYIRALEEASIACFQQHGNSKSIGNKRIRRARRSCASRMNRARPRRRVCVSDTVHAHAVRFDMWHRTRCHMQDPLPHLQPVQAQCDLLYKVGFSEGWPLTTCFLLAWGMARLILQGQTCPVCWCATLPTHAVCVGQVCTSVSRALVVSLRP